MYVDRDQSGYFVVSVSTVFGAPGTRCDIYVGVGLPLLSLQTRGWISPAVLYKLLGIVNNMRNPFEMPATPSEKAS